MITLKIALIGSDPVIWRRVVVSSNANLGKLHKIIQVTMGWQSSHLHEFEIDGSRYGDPSFDDYGSVGDPETLDQKKLTLGEVSNITDRFEYRYDFGDGWRHEIKIEKIEPTDAALILPVCIGGENACPPEDCGGLGGYDDLLQALAAKNIRKLCDPEYVDPRVAWVGGFFDPRTFDPNRINRDHLWKGKL